MVENEKIRRYVYSQENFSDLIEFFINKGRCPRSWKEIIDLGLAKTEVSARALLVIVKDFNIVDDDYQFTPLGTDLRTNSKRATAFKQILEKCYPDLLEVYHVKPEPFPDKELDDSLIQEGYKSIDPRLRIIRMFKYLLMQSGNPVKQEATAEVREKALPKKMIEKPKATSKASFVSKDILKASTPSKEEPLPTKTPSYPQEQPQESLPIPPPTPKTETAEIGNENVFSILNATGKPILVVIPAGSTKADVMNVIKLLETTIS